MRLKSVYLLTADQWVTIVVYVKFMLIVNNAPSAKSVYS